MEIQQINITEIKEYEKNAKKHDTRQINNVMESIKEFGMVQPIVIDDNNTINKDDVYVIRDGKKIKYKDLKA